MAIVKNLAALVEEGRLDFAALLFRSIWGAEPGRLPYLNRPSFAGEVVACWRARWVPGTEVTPMHAYSWFLWGAAARRTRPSLTVRVSESEAIAAMTTAVREAA